MNRRADTEYDDAAESESIENHEAADEAHSTSSRRRPELPGEEPLGRPPVFQPPGRPPISVPPSRPPILIPPGGTLPSDPPGDNLPTQPGSNEQVVLLPDYFPGDVLLPDPEDPEGPLEVVRALRRATADIKPLSHGLGVEVNTARKQLLALLESPAFATIRARLTVVPAGPGLVDSLVQRQFGLALQHVDAIRATTAPHLEPISEATIHKAFTTSPADYFAVTSTDPNEPDAGVLRTLPGYSGPVVTTTQRFRLSDLSELVAGGPERDFRLPLLRGECLGGLRRFGEALAEYEGLLADDELSEPRREFTALRAALAHLARGDQVYRSERRLSPTVRDQALADYAAAVKVLDENGVRPDGLLFQEIVAAAQRQHAKITAGFNALGFRDSFVPPQPFEFLATRARENAAAAKDAEDRFVEFQLKGDSLADLEAELLAALADADDNKKIAAGNQSIARAKVQRAETQAAIVRSQQAFLVPATVFGGIESILRPFGSGAGSLQGTQAQLGITSTIIGFGARNEELGYQARIADLDVQIAQQEQTIADLEFAMAARRFDFIDSRLEITGGRNLNKDVFYALAQRYEAIAKSRLETAILIGYLYERAVAFHLGRPSLTHPISFDYADGPTGILGASKALEDALTDIDNEFVLGDPPERDDFTDKIFLRTDYPIEFNNLLQTGVMDFVISLYQLNKLRPGSTMGRILDVVVELRGSLPSNLSFAGRLIHQGRFLLRNGPSTLEPAAERLIPTTEQIEEALAAQERGDTILASVGGVIVFDLGLDTKELDASTLSDTTNTTQTYLLDTFVGHGPAALWRLEIDPTLLGSVTEIVLHVHVDAFETDPNELSEKVRELIARFEAEAGETVDRVLPVSLRGQFPDAFDALASGTGSIELSDTEFPFGTVNPELKAVVALALDEDGRGVEGVGVEIAKPDASFTLARTTGANGFSEDVTAPIEFLDIEDRFTVIGQWTVSLTDPGQAALLDDLQLFFIYQFDQL
jgi:hypothetical protein